MRCLFCASEESFAVISYSQAASLLRSLKRSSIESVVLGGGEPLLWPHGLERLCRLAKDLGFLVQLCTNGVSLPRGFEKLSGIDRYILPLESMDPGLHDRLRKHSAGHHALVLARIESLAGGSRELTISTVVNRENVGRLREIATYLIGMRRRGVKLHAWHLYRFLPVGRGGSKHAAELAVTREEYRRAVAEIQALRPGFPVFRRSDMLRSGSVEFFWFEGGRLRVGSQARGGRSAGCRTAQDEHVVPQHGCRSATQRLAH